MTPKIGTLNFRSNIGNAQAEHVLHPTTTALTFC